MCIPKRQEGSVTAGAIASIPKNCSTIKTSQEMKTAMYDFLVIHNIL